jgi:hypothetical protein
MVMEKVRFILDLWSHFTREGRVAAGVFACGESWMNSATRWP